MIWNADQIDMFPDLSAVKEARRGSSFLKPLDLGNCYNSQMELNTKDSVKPQAVLSAFPAAGTKGAQPNYEERSLYLAPAAEVFESLSAMD